MVPYMRMAGIFALLGLLSVLPSAHSASAQGVDDVFTVSGVEVDATAATAAAARDRALAEGQRAALGRLLKRIVLASDRNKLPKFSGSAVTDLVRDFEVSKERRSSVRYLAVLKVRFKSDSIRSMLRSRDIAFAVTRSRPILVLPVFEVAGAYSLWEDPNPWRDAWQAAPPSDGLVPLIPPTSKVGNAVVISAEQAVRGDDDRLAAIAQRYGAEGVLVAVAGFGTGSVEDGDQGTQKFLRVTLNRMGEKIPNQTRLESFTLREGESDEAAMARAVAAITDQIEDDWKRENRLRFDVDRQLTVTVPLTSLADWLFVKRRLDGIAFVRESDLLYLSRSQARLTIKYIGDESQLALALDQNDISLKRGPVDWILRRNPKNRALRPGRTGTGDVNSNGVEASAPAPKAGNAP